MRVMPAALLAATMAFGVACSGSGSGAMPFKTVASVDQLMLGPIAHASRTYWNAVSTVVDKDGIHEHAPANDTEWTTTWSAAITLAESGNLLMMADRTRGEDWNAFAVQLVDAGNRAAQAAEARSAEQVLEQGEQIYAACTACHMKFVMGGEVPRDTP
jgi:hypothetical protein